MNLKLELPSGVAENDVVFSLPYDIHKGGGKSYGHVTVTQAEIKVYEKDKLVGTFKTDNFSEYDVQMLVGCSMFRGKGIDGKWFSFCAFTQKYFLRYAELAKILDYYVNTGTFVEETSADEPSCPKCGISLNGETICPFCADKTGIFVKLIKRLAPHKKLFILSFISTVILYCFDVITPMIQRIFIDEIIVPKNEDWNLFGILSASMISISLINFVLMFIMEKCNIRISSAYGRDLRRDIFNKTQELSTNSINRRTAGELINRVSSDAARIQDFVTREGKEMIFQTLSLISLVIIMLFTNWKLALIVIIPLPIAFFVTSQVFKHISMRYGRVWRHECASSDLIHDIIHGIRVVKSYGNEDTEIERFGEATKKMVTSTRKADTFWYIAMPPIRYIISIGEFAALYFGGSMVLGAEIQLGELVQFTSYVYMLYGPVQWLVQLPRVLSQTMVSANKVYEVLDEETDVKDRDSAQTINIKGDIDFEHVFFGYKAYNPVLKDISCSIKAGEMIGIVGHSGVGKSTFINLLMRLYDPTSGSIKVDGIDLRDITQNSLRSQVGVVLQETFLFNGTIFENLIYAKPDATFEEIVEAAKIANAHDFIVKLPDGYNTYVGERGYNLSGGERQRVAIARAILHNPKILILDEATASLDTQTEKQIQEALNRLIKGRTTIAIAHRLSTLSNADRLIVLDKGRVSEIGSHSELMKNKGVYYSLVMAQRQTARIKSVKTDNATA